MTSSAPGGGDRPIAPDAGGLHPVSRVRRSIATAAAGLRTALVRPATRQAPSGTVGAAGRAHAARIGLLAASLLWMLPARAQPATTDLPLAQAAAVLDARLPAVLDGTPPNQPVPWDDPASGLSGSVVAFAPTLGGDRFCRALRYTVSGASRQFAVEGERCRTGSGGWGPGRVPDRLYEAPAASPLIRDLEAALRRLDYYDGPVDGTASAALGDASLRFERDEGVAPDAEPSPGLLELADAAINRIPQPGSCSPEHPVPAGWFAACGSAR